MQDLAPLSPVRARALASPRLTALEPHVFETVSLWRGEQPLLPTLRERYGGLRLADLEGSYVLICTES